MLSDLPIEILEQIVSHLPTASSIVSFCCVDRSLHKKLSANNYSIFRAFVQHSFPSFNPPPLWRDAAYVLTSRSRAWDRRAISARECVLPRDDWLSQPVVPGGQQKIGFIPIIDSYATWTGPTWAHGKELLAWSEWGRLRVRIKENGNETWSSWKTPDDHLPEKDLLDVRILRPHQHSQTGEESFLLRRANKEIIRLDLRPERQRFEQVTQFATSSDDVDCMDVNSSTNPTLVVCNNKSIHLFPISSDSAVTEPTDTHLLDQPYHLKHRVRCAKFLSDTTLALATQFIEGRQCSPINIYSLAPTGLINTPLRPQSSIDTSFTSHLQTRNCANTLTPLSPTSTLSNRPGQIFLSGWSDGVVRLYDTRDPSTSHSEYLDVVDDGQILSLCVIGHERFVAGSHQNACLKVFDLRMPGGKVYDYLNASNTHQKPPQPRPRQRNINIFLAFPLSRPRNHWNPLPTSATAGPSIQTLPRYRGSIYSLSLPDPCSPTIYAGIENHVVSLSSTNTDDALSISSPPYSSFHTGAVSSDILNLSCYERPRSSHASTDPVLLRKQLDWERIVDPQASAVIDAEAGWDMRWRLDKYEGIEGNGRRGGHRGQWHRGRRRRGS